MDDVKWLMAKEIPHLRRYALVLTRNQHAADDLVQDCLERAIRKRHQWERRGNIRGWLYRILYSLFVNQGSHRNRLRREVSLADSDIAASLPPRQEDRVVCRQIGDAMDRLPGDQRAAIALTAVEGFSYDEAANILGVPIGTLRSRLFRGRETLRDIYVEDAEQAHIKPPVHLKRVK